MILSTVHLTRVVTTCGFEDIVQELIDRLNDFHVRPKQPMQKHLKLLIGMVIYLQLRNPLPSVCVFYLYRIYPHWQGGRHRQNTEVQGPAEDPWLMPG